MGVHTIPIGGNMMELWKQNISLAKTIWPIHRWHYTGTPKPKYGSHKFNPGYVGKYEQDRVI